MRQTISKDHSNETLIQNQAIIIGAHCNSKIRKERCLKLLQEVKNRFGDDYLIIFCSHLPIETEFYDYVNYAIYNKQNKSIKLKLKIKQLQENVFFLHIIFFFYLIYYSL